ncbi:YpsA SLOG family protein [Thermodesulfobacteriota bacterium]
MIKKIVSGGQTGADLAALDTAIELGIPHGGWIPKGRKTENGRLSEKYHLKEIKSIDYAQRTELNIVDSDGTILFSHGKLTGGSALTLKLAKKHNRPCFHIDLDDLSDYKAAEIITDWLDIRNIEVLNVAGSRASKDPQIYEDVQNVLKSVLYPPPEKITSNYPHTVKEAVDRLINELPLKDKTTIAKMEEHELVKLHTNLGMYMRKNFKLWSGNVALLKSCESVASRDNLVKKGAAAIIVRELWKKLKENHGLRIVK